MNERLLKRIRLWSRAEVGHSDFDSNQLALSIRDDLGKMYNTRQGTVLIDPKFGLPDFNDMLNGYGVPDTESLQKMFLALTRKYEPRLSAVKIDMEETSQAGGQLALRLNAMFEFKNQSLPFTAGMILNDDGSTSIIS